MSLTGFLFVNASWGVMQTGIALARESVHACIVTVLYPCLSRFNGTAFVSRIFLTWQSQNSLLCSRQEVPRRKGKKAVSFDSAMNASR
jgi:hypothetical protein